MVERTGIEKKWPTVGGGGGLFLKLQDGETVKVRLASDTVYFDSEFKGKLSARLAWVVWNHDVEKAQIWATNGATYNSIKDLVLDDEYGDPRQYDIKITRTGVEQQTRYSVRPGTKREPLAKDAIDACADIDPIEILGNSDYAQHVMWLEEHREEKSINQASVKDDVPIQDVEIEDIGDEPINLDDIPF